MKLTMGIVVEAYHLYCKTTLMRPYDPRLNAMAYELRKGLYMKLAEQQGVPLSDLPLPAEAFALVITPADGHTVGMEV